MKLGKTLAAVTTPQEVRSLKIQQASQFAPSTAQRLQSLSFIAAPTADVVWTDSGPLKGHRWHRGNLDVLWRMSTSQTPLFSLPYLTWFSKVSFFVKNNTLYIQALLPLVWLLFPFGTICIFSPLAYFCSLQWCSISDMIHLQFHGWGLPLQANNHHSPSSPDAVGQSKPRRLAKGIVRL